MAQRVTKQSTIGQAGMKILMPPEDVDACQTIIERHRPRLVVEWGAGGSTIRFSQFPTIERWYSIEHHQDWYAKVSAEASAKVVVQHVPIESDDYVVYPKRLGLVPDLVLVDGRRRVECLRVAREILAPDGVVLLHDSSRLRYEEGMSGFSRRLGDDPRSRAAKAGRR